MRRAPADTEWTALTLKVAIVGNGKGRVYVLSCTASARSAMNPDWWIAGRETLIKLRIDTPFTRIYGLTKFLCGWTGKADAGRDEPLRRDHQEIGINIENRRGHGDPRTRC